MAPRHAHARKEGDGNQRKELGVEEIKIGEGRRRLAILLVLRPLRVDAAFQHRERSEGLLHGLAKIGNQRRVEELRAELNERRENGIHRGAVRGEIAFLEALRSAEVHAFRVGRRLGQRANSRLQSIRERGRTMQQARKRSTTLRTFSPIARIT